MYSALTEGAIMKKIKLIPFYLLSIINFLASVVVATDYPSTMRYDMHWGYEGCGWAYENRFNYTIMTLTILLIIIAPTIYAWKKRKTNLIKAYIILSIPALLYLIQYIYFINFFNI